MVDHLSPESAPRARADGSLSVAGLFAGIGGIELGLHRAGHQAELLCELDEAAQRVLRAQFPQVDVVGDVRSISRLPRVDLVTAGFPCQDLSQAGRTAGIGGTQSGLVGEVFRLVQDEDRAPTWLLLENVPFMLQLDRGNGMRFLVDSLEALGFTWAYRVVDTRAFGLPQRRQRVLLLASRTEDPRPVLFSDDAGPRTEPDQETVACGFYWTEGTRGLGWAIDAVPTLKGGSALGIPSPPAIRLPRGGGVVTPDIRDAERLQGFPANWTRSGPSGGRRSEGARWKMVGNAVSVPVAEWLGKSLRDPRSTIELEQTELAHGAWPAAAWGRSGIRYRVSASRWPSRKRYQHLESFLRYEPRPLSQRASTGFLSRAEASSLNFPPGFLDEVRAHLGRIRRAA